MLLIQYLLDDEAIDDSSRSLVARGGFPMVAAVWAEAMNTPPLGAAPHCHAVLCGVCAVRSSRAATRCRAVLALTPRLSPEPGEGVFLVSRGVLPAPFLFAMAPAYGKGAG